MDGHEKTVKQGLNYLWAGLTFYCSLLGARRGLNKVTEEQRLNNRFSQFKYGLDDDFHKRCLNLV